jgi:hypothetical protein
VPELFSIFSPLLSGWWTLVFLWGLRPFCIVVDSAPVVLLTRVGCGLLIPQGGNPVIAAVLLETLLARVAQSVRYLVLHLSLVGLLQESCLILVDSSAIPHVVIPHVDCRDTFP